MNSLLRKSLIAVAVATAVGGFNISFAADAAPTADKKAEAPKAATPAKPAAETAKPAAEGKQVVADKHNVSYMVGMDIGKGLSSIKDEIDLAVVIQALQASMKGDKTELSQEEALKVRQDFMQKLQAKQAAKDKEVAEKNKKESEDFQQLLCL